LRKIPELDALRGLAALGVVIHHAYPKLFFLGWSCVDLFFVLSGFLISSVIIEHVHDRRFFATFFYRRALRIWPVYYLTLLVVLAFNAWSRHGYSTDGLLWHMFFLQNVQHYWHAAVPAFIHPFAPSWSVAVEEQFYLLWPASLWLVGRRGIIPLACSLIGLSVVSRLCGLTYDVLVGRFDGLAMGSILAVLWRSVSTQEQDRLSSIEALARRLIPVGVAALCVVCLIAYRFWGNPMPQWTPIAFFAFSAFYFSVVGLAICWSGRPITWPLRNKGLRWLGSISYAMYMFHLPILTYAPALLDRIGLRSAAARTVLEWIAIFALPTLSYWLIEKPILSLKDRWAYRKAESPSLAA
jgi:peptidoglycan/LPS O-acetylase OafA/YrhL